MLKNQENLYWKNLINLFEETHFYLSISIKIDVCSLSVVDKIRLA